MSPKHDPQKPLPQDASEDQTAPKKPAVPTCSKCGKTVLHCACKDNELKK